MILSLLLHHRKNGLWNCLGNVFSSLEGLPFEWNIVPSGPAPKSGRNALGFASLSEDVYKPSSVRGRMASRGVQSDLVLLKGLESGQSLVQVKLLEEGYQDVEIASVVIDVIEPFTAIPGKQPLRVAPGSDVQAAVRILRDQSPVSQVGDSSKISLISVHS